MKVIVHENDLLILEATILNEDLVNGGEIFIGRDDDCHIQLDSHKVSRHHAVVSFTGENLIIRSLSEFKKVRLLGNEVLEGQIHNGSQFSIDNYTITIDGFDAGTQEDEKQVKIESESIAPTDSDMEVIGSPEPVVDEDHIEEEESTDVIDTLSETEDLDSEDTDDTGFMTDDNAEPLEDKEVSDFADEAGDAFEEDSGFGDNDDGFSDSDDEFGGGDSFDDDDDSSTQVFQSFASYKLKIFGEYAPFDTFTIDEPKTMIGRDPANCKILLSDPEVSKVHATITKTLVNLTIEDNGSSNGIILNGERINKSELNNGDEFIIGETTFTVSISSDLLDQEQGRLMPIEEGQEIIIESDDDLGGGIEFDGPTDGDELDFATENKESVVEEKSFIKKILKDPRKRLYAIVGTVLFLLFMFVDSEPETTTENTTGTPAPTNENKPKPKKFTKAVQDIIDQNYALALAKYNNDQFYQAKEYINIVKKYDPNYKLTASLDKSIQESLDAITRAKEEEEKQKERLVRQKRVKEMVVKAREAVAARQVKAAKEYFANIYEIDPENIDVPPLKIEIDSFVEEEARKKQEAQLAAAKRKSMVDKLAPAKQTYLKKEWYLAISKLEAFLRLEGMDEDLIKDGTSMLNDSRRQLSSSLDPLLSKARSFQEGQDLKQAFETYGEVLKFDPSSEEALNKRAEIFGTLEKRSKILYREALIKEDLSDFANAKEKFQEVQQISPINSEYYIKATDKLNNYLE